ncbi:hypothetical protein [Desertivirga arenae]|uniref:hypothetical protein n=1 Tax=Desertivirga arenae TaxID=2810309 RepID=UPI001A9626F5|nr:hypothetical protein [Pedobacter sp. SYSU D00823]
MQIIYLKSLEENSVRKGTHWSSPNIPMSILEIEELEIKYNSSKPFPIALRELLHLAGKDCYFLDKGLNESQEELQKFVRENLRDDVRKIDRPFFAIDVYNTFDQFLFVYLDEGEDPPVYEAHYSDHPSREHWISLVIKSLSKFVENNVERVKQGRNPF